MCGPVGLREGESFLDVLIVWESQRRMRWGVANKNKERRKQRSKERRVVQRRSQGKYLGWGTCMLRGTVSWWLTLQPFKVYFPPPSQAYIL